MRIDRPVPSDLLASEPPVDSSFVEDDPKDGREGPKQGQTPSGDAG